MIETLDSEKSKDLMITMVIQGTLDQTVTDPCKHGNMIAIETVMC